jgi:uncharacterized membrane protein YukC
MITEELINNADEKVKSLCSENKKLWYWIYILLGILAVLVLTLIYFFYYGKLKFSHQKDEELIADHVII